MFELYDCETMERVTHTESETYEECLWLSLAWITEDWDTEEINNMFSSFKTAEQMLTNFNYSIKKF